MSDTESLEPIGDESESDAAPPVAAAEIRAEIDDARAATDRFRSKASELINELREREVQARNDAILAEAAAEEARARAQEAIEHAKQIEARASAKAREAIQKAGQVAGEAERRSTELEELAGRRPGARPGGRESDR